MGIKVEEIEDGVFKVTMTGIDYHALNKGRRETSLTGEGLIGYWLSVGVRVLAWLASVA